MPIVQQGGTFVMKPEIYPAADGGYRWRYKAGNHEITQAAHESFSSPAACKENFDAFRREHLKADSVEWVEVES